MFEALPERARRRRGPLLDAACAWLAGARHASAARIGFGLLDTPLQRPTPTTRCRPARCARTRAEYHALIKRCGLRDGAAATSTTRSPVDARAASSAGRARSRAARRAGLRARAAPRLPRPRSERGCSATLWNETLREPLRLDARSRPSSRALFVLRRAPRSTRSVFALADGEPLGFCFVPPDDPIARACSRRGRALRADGAAEHRSRSACARAATRARRQLRDGRPRLISTLVAARLDAPVSYTLVLDDNWPSRRTGEGLGGSAARELCRLSSQLRGPLMAGSCSASRADPNQFSQRDCDFSSARCAEWRSRYRSSSLGSTGFTKCWSKPAAWLRSRSSL